MAGDSQGQVIEGERQRRQETYTNCCGKLLAAVADTIKIDVSEYNQATILIDDHAPAERKSIPHNSRFNIRYKQAEMTVNCSRTS